MKFVALPAIPNLRRSLCLETKQVFDEFRVLDMGGYQYSGVSQLLAPFGTQEEVGGRRSGRTGGRHCGCRVR